LKYLHVGVEVTETMTRGTEMEQQNGTG